MKEPYNDDDNKPLRREEKNLLWSRIDNSLRKRRRLMWMKAFAAAAVVLMVTGTVFLQFRRKTDLKKPDINYIAHINGELLKGQSQTTILEFGGTPQTVADTVLRIKGQEYNTSDDRTVYVPYGKRMKVELPDGTNVWLNSGSFLTFPGSFDGHERQVYLNGEAYFDVSRQHKSFKVLLSENTISVLGTTFNVSSYEDDSRMQAELITGSVAFENKNNLFKPFRLKPGQEVSIENGGAVPLLRETGGEGILWIKKQMTLDNTSIAALMRKLERFYNVHIDLPAELAHANLAYSGRINLQMPVNELLESIYELENYRITLKEREVHIQR